jgi:large subunit ribosomal protein L21
MTGDQTVYAIFEDGGRQYRVQEGDLIRVDLRDLGESQQIEFDHVLLVGEGEGVKIGQPYVSGAKVVADVKGEIKGEKVVGIVFRRRKNVRVKRGHRQRHLDVTVKQIVV